MTLASEMADWEVHALRGLVTVLIVQTQLYAREHPEAKSLARSFVRFKRRYQNKQLEAFFDPTKRAIRE